MYTPLPGSGAGCRSGVGTTTPAELGRLRQGTFVACEEFLALRERLGFRAHHCTPGAGWEKGLVAGLVGYMRRNYLTPVPEFADLVELNRWLGQRAAGEERAGAGADFGVQTRTVERSRRSKHRPWPTTTP